MKNERQEFSRVDRVRKAIQRELGDILRTEIKDPRLEDLVISITEVDLTPDLSVAKVYFSIFLDDNDERQEVMTILISHQAKARKALGQRIRLRHTPELLFKFDDSLERGVRMSQLLDQIARGELD
ncbi:MAG: 30S ribosome-binding factor RbfA [Vampirovibrio sp.]|jgi:ribosome-binding factor A